MSAWTTGIPNNCATICFMAETVLRTPRAIQEGACSDDAVAGALRAPRPHHVRVAADAWQCGALLSVRR